VPNAVSCDYFYFGCLHSLLAIPAADLSIYHCCLIKENIRSASSLHITPPPPRLSANEVLERLLPSFLPHGLCYCIYPRRPALNYRIACCTPRPVTRQSTKITE
jgi:hypothetical protein